MISNILDTSKINNKTNNGMVLIWSRYNYNNYDYYLESSNNKDITYITIEPDTTANKQFFSGREY